jgi:hypothetical protein
MTDERKQIHYTAGDLMEPPVNETCRALWSATMTFVLVTWAFEKQCGVAQSAIAGAVVAFLLSLPARRRTNVIAAIPQTELLELSVLGCADAFKEAVREASTEDDNDPEANYSWTIDGFDSTANKIDVRIENKSLADSWFLISATFHKQETRTRATYEYKWAGASANRTPDIEREIAHRIGVFRANYELKTGVARQTSLSWMVTLYGAKLRLLRALNVKRLSISYALLSLLLFIAVVPTIPQDFSTKPLWYVPIVDIEQILTCIGVMLYAFDVRKLAVVFVWRALFPLLVLAECTNLVYSFSHLDSSPALNNSAPVEIALSVMLVYTVFVVPAFYANYMLAYRRVRR